MTVFTIHLARQAGSDAYDVHKPLPYPIHLDTRTGIAQWGHERYHLVGFAYPHDPFEFRLSREEFEDEPRLADGMLPIVSSGNGLETVTLKVTRTTISEGVTK